LTAKIFQFKQTYVKVSAVCHTCETSWVADIKEHIYKKYVHNVSKCICPCCGGVDTNMVKGRKYLN